MADQSHTNGAELTTPQRSRAASVLTRRDLAQTGANDSLGPDEIRTPRGIFDTHSTLFTRYTARIVLRDKLLGGIPKDPKLIEGWLRSRAGLTDGDEVRHTMLRTLVELGVDVDASMSFEQLERASETVAARKQTTGFKVGERGLYIESRQFKAMPKESTNVVFGGERFGPTRKTGKPFVAERVFIEPDRLWLGVREPAGVARIPRADHARLPVSRTVGGPVGTRPGERPRRPAVAGVRALLRRALAAHRLMRHRQPSSGRSGAAPATTHICPALHASLHLLILERVWTIDH